MDRLIRPSCDSLSEDGDNPLSRLLIGLLVCSSSWTTLHLRVLGAQEGFVAWVVPIRASSARQWDCKLRGRRVV